MNGIHIKLCGYGNPASRVAKCLVPDQRDKFLTVMKWEDAEDKRFYGWSTESGAKVYYDFDTNPEVGGWILSGYSPDGKDVTDALIKIWESK